MNIVAKSRTIHGKELHLEVGRYAEQAGAAVTARIGDTIVLATVTASSRETSLDYFPLSVEYIERLYAGGRIKGSRWVKREGRPTDDAILTGRLIDRSIRPLFDKNYKHDVQVVITVLSVDGENDPDVLGLVATSAALSLSAIPWNGPIAGVRMGYVKGENGNTDAFLVNPTTTEQEFSEFDFVVSSSREKVVMLEGGFCETPKDIVFQATQKAKEVNREIIELIEELIKDIRQPKVTVASLTPKDELKAKLTKEYKKELDDLFAKKAEKEFSDDDTNALVETIAAANADSQFSAKEIRDAIDTLFKKHVRSLVLSKKKRLDGRGPDDIRELGVGVGILPRTHGSALFRRGQTQVLTVATLGTPSLEQLIESPMGEESKRYIHHYSMPPYSVGETGRIGVPSRREIGHGALAEKALLSVIPSEDVFPYTIRLVSEVMSSNGSTSMASTCGSTLALMDAGVPIKEPVAGISIGMMSEEDSFVLLTDIMGIEDFSGDMDFKVAGTRNGITAIQLDIKIDGLTDEMIKGALEKSETARETILETMLAVIPSHREMLSQYAPKVRVVKVPEEKIGEVIGPGGKMIRQIIAVTGATVDVEDDGTVYISGVSEEAVNKAVDWVKGLTTEVIVGQEFEGEVKRILPFGAFVELVPGKEGMVHVSKMARGYVNDPSEVVQVGQKVKVKVIEVDERNRINLGMVELFEGGSPRPPREYPEQRRRQGRRRE